MEAFAFVAKESSFPCPVVIVARDSVGYYLLFPSGHCAAVSTETYLESVSKTHGLTFFRTPFTVMEGHVGFAFGEDDVIIGTYKNVFTAIHKRSQMGIAAEAAMSLFQQHS